MKPQWLLFVFTALLLCTACSSTPQETGTLQGHVTIGPLVPVLREGEPEPTPAPEVYAARQIVVFSQDGKKEIARLEINPQGMYSTILPVGDYLIDIDHDGMDSASGLPAQVSILANQITQLDIDIDTGIR